MNENVGHNDQSLKVIPLSGVEEVGINCTVFEYKNKLVVIDMGLGFADADMYGVDFLVPNVEYLTKRKQDIEGIIITHGHLDHIGALPYLLPRLGYPDIYGTEFTIELIKAGLKDHNVLEQAKLHVITPESILQSGDFKISFFRVNHSIPQCVGVLMETPAGKVVHTGDFKFDNSPINEPVADYARMANIGELGIDLMLSDSTNSLRKGHPISETDVAINLETIMERAKGRIVVAAFSGLVGRLYQLIKLAEKHNRKVAIAGYSMNQTLRIAEEIGYIKPTPGIFVPIQKINRFHDDRVMILATGSQGESNAALFKMASDEYKTVQLKKGDTVILSAGTIPGNNVAVQTLIDAITSRGALVRQSEDMDFFTSGHGYQEDQKIMLNLIKPKFFMPVHGYQYFLREHGRTAMQVGINEKNIIIAKRGNIIEGTTKDGFKITGQIKSLPLLVSGTGVGDVGSSVLAERQQLGNNGVIAIDIALDKNTKQIIGDIRIATRGFVYVKTSRDMLAEITEIAKKTTLTMVRKTLDVAAIKTELDTKISDFVRKEIGRSPVILPLISFMGSDGENEPRRRHSSPRKPLVKQAEELPLKNPAEVAQRWNLPTDSLDLMKKEG